MLVVLVVLFAGYPIIEGVRSTSQSNNGGFNAGGINASGQIPKLSAFELIDPDTPEDAYHWTSMETGEQWDLVFSDEFNRDGRTFYPGDDPFWEAVDLHYWSTKNLEYYDPRNVYTKDGHLVIELNDRPSHGMDYTGGSKSIALFFSDNSAPILEPVLFHWRLHRSKGLAPRYQRHCWPVARDLDDGQPRSCWLRRLP